MRTLAEVWSATPSDITAASDISSDENEFREVVGTLQGKKIKVDVDIIRNPKKHGLARN